MKILRIITLCAGLCVLAAFGLVFFVILSDYQPNAVEPITVRRSTQGKLSSTGEHSITTFNIGYAALDAESDFFMDGGTRSRGISKQVVQDNLAATMDFLRDLDSDFFLLQEIDVNSRRSYGVNERKAIEAAFPGMYTSFAYNYVVSWVPVPLSNPLGNVSAGLMTLSASQTLDATRYRLPGIEPIPDRYFKLDRCITGTRHELDNGKILYIMNLHLSAYDKGGNIRKQQIGFIIDFVAKNYDPASTYIIFGGDWNHVLTDAYVNTLPWGVDWVAYLPEEINTTGFLWGIDPQTPTLRSLEKPLSRGPVATAVIDGFFVSPNLDIVSVHTTDLGFAHSDHNPVTLTFRFR